MSVEISITDQIVEINETSNPVEISVSAGAAGTAVWGGITGTLSNQTDIQNALNAKYNNPTGTTAQYLRGDGSLATFPTIGGGTWGSITGTLSNQTDLQNALNAKFDDPTGTTSQYLRGDGSLATFPTIPSGTVTSVGLTMPSAFSVANSPVTSSGTLAVTGAGTAAQYIRGDGQLANFPDNQGGGSSVNYYLNGSVNQGTFGGDTYYEMSKTPVLGAGTNFTRTNAQGNGYIASFITDAGDPSLLNIPSGNWNVEFYFQANSNAGNPQFYAELYKVDASNNFTLVGSGSTNPEGITNGTTIDQYYTAIPVPQTSLLVTDRLAIRIFVITSGRTITLHTENSNLCEVITTLSTGLNALNGLTAQVQYFATGTSGTDFAISSATDTHTFNLPTASATNRGALSSADWTTFNSKQAALGFTPVTNARTLTINGVTQDLTANRSWSVDSILGVDHLMIGASATINFDTYNNGASGVGAYLCAINALPGDEQTFTINGNTVVIGDTILVTGRIPTYENGLYYFDRAEVGSDNTTPYLVRLSGYDSPSEFNNSILVQIRKRTFPNTANVFVGSITNVTTIGTSEILFVPVDEGILSGTNANRPSYPLTGETYYQTDGTTGQYVYNGTTWDRLVTRKPIVNYFVQHLTSSSYSDSTTYYFGSVPNAPTTTQGLLRGIFNQSGTIKSIYLFFRSIVSPTTEVIAISLWRATGGGTLSQIASTTFSWPGSTSFTTLQWTGLNIAVSPNQTYEFKIDVPNMAANPTSVLMSGNIEVELT
jgi:hypothetical protein